LQEIKGNPEILLWNGYVGDYQHIAPETVESTLVKESLAGYLEYYQLRIFKNSGEYRELTPEEKQEATESMPKISKWEQNSHVDAEDIKAKRYKKKRVVYLKPKLRGELNYFRGVGDVAY
jgi:hypothetical protein